MMSNVNECRRHRQLFSHGNQGSSTAGSTWRISSIKFNIWSVNWKAKDSSETDSISEARLTKKIPLWWKTSDIIPVYNFAQTPPISSISISELEHVFLIRRLNQVKLSTNLGILMQWRPLSIHSGHGEHKEKHQWIRLNKRAGNWGLLRIATFNLNASINPT